MKNLINCPFIPIAKRPGSHRGAAGVMYGDMIKEKYGNCDVNYGGEIKDHNAYDTLWVYHGTDWSGGINMFGGVYGFPYVQNTVNFSQFKGKVYSIGIDFPPYHEMVKSKLDSAKKEVKQDNEIDNVAAGESAEQPADLSNAMAAYSAAISKTKDIKLSK